MTEIRWKNGGPLFLQPSPGNPNGLVATNQDCCCPPPPPPRCWECFDVCSYVAEVTSPAALASKSSNATCDPPVAGYGQKLIEFMYEELDLPHSVAGNRFFPADASFSVVSAGDPRGGIYGAFRAASGHSLNGFAGTYIRPDGVEYNVQCGLRAEIIVLESCLPGGTPGPHSVAVFFNVDVFTLGALGSEEQQYRLRKFGYFHVPSTCVSAPQKQCFPHEQEISLINTPLEISADKNGTSLGAYQDESESWSATPSYGDRAKDIGQALRDALTATFRITSRPNCEPEIYCDCNAITEGLTISVLGAADFIWNQEEQYQTYSDLANFYSYSYSPQGPGNEARIVIEQWNLSITETYARWTIDIFCEAVPSGIPSPYRWYGSQLVECFEYDAGSVVNWTKKTYMGYFNCEADPCGTNGRSLGDLYPAGPWRDGELVSEVTPDTYGPCAPPLPYDFRVDNDAECP